jgi:class I fructose-bisphosphate aldolase
LDKKRWQILFKTQMHKLLNEGKGLFLAYDQGLEHGPTDFNLQNINPEYILRIAEKGRYNAVILHHGIAEKYYQTYRKKLKLILKVNGKTRIPKIDPISAKVCSLKRAVKLGADAIGYTIYDGSPLEPKIFEDFGKVVEEAHDHGLPVVAWMYPRGKFVPNDSSTDILAYSARVGLELGADMIKIKYNGDPAGFKWIVKSAGKAKVFAAGGAKAKPEGLLKDVKDIMEAGASGMAIGRNIWQSENPLGMTKALKNIIFGKKSVKDAMKSLK